MKLIIFLLLVFNSFSFIHGQFTFEKHSVKTKIDIKFPPPDSIKPVVKVQLPLKKEGFPVYSKDSVFTISGISEDNSGKVTMYIQDEKQIVTNGSFKIDVNLKPGPNTIFLKAVDRRDNTFTDSLKIVYDPNSDVIPPTLKIIEPKVIEYRGIKTVPKYSEADSNLLVKGKVLDEGNILGVWVNGELVEVNENSEFVFFLFNRYDSIMIEAADSYGNLTVEKFLVSTVNFGIVPDQINYHALIIAVEDYYDSRIPQLDYPVKDAEALMDVLTSFYTFEKNNVMLLKNPSRSLILDHFQKLRKKLGDNDNLLIFYAGHGNLDTLNQQGYWIPVDGTHDISTNWISNDDVKDYIRGIKTRHTMVIADACFAGSLSRDLSLSGPELLEFEQTYKYPSRHMLSSGSDLKKVPDKSVFFEYLVRKLKDNQKKILSGSELSYLLKEPVMNNSNQKPAYQVIPNTGDDGLGDFIFIKR